MNATVAACGWFSGAACGAGTGGVGIATLRISALRISAAALLFVVGGHAYFASLGVCGLLLVSYGCSRAPTYVRRVTRACNVGRGGVGWQ